MDFVVLSDEIPARDLATGLIDLGPPLSQSRNEQITVSICPDRLVVRESDFEYRLEKDVA